MIGNNSKILFLREFFAEFHNTGAFCATSKWAAEKLVAPLKGNRAPMRIVELGAGTGSVTVKILESMIAGDQLTICEINPRFMASLKVKLESNRDFQDHKKQITFFEGPAQELPEGAPVDVIVCALPFLNFTPAMVQEIFGKLQRMSGKNTIMTYYEYIGLRNLGKLFAPPERKRRIRQIDQFFNGLYSECLMKRTPVWLNILPINIYALNFAA